jgi:hypothetical protein
MKGFSVILLFAAILISCTKKTQVSGTVYDAFNNPLPHANIKILIKPKIDAWQITTSDANGNYQFSFRAKKNFKYSVSASYPLLYVSTSKPIKIGKTQVIDLYP